MCESIYSACSVFIKYWLHGEKSEQKWGTQLDLSFHQVSNANEEVGLCYHCCGFFSVSVDFPAHLSGFAICPDSHTTDYGNAYNMSRMGNLWPTRYCWGIIPAISVHLSCWLGLMRVGSQSTPEGSQVPHPCDMGMQDVPLIAMIKFWLCWQTDVKAISLDHMDHTKSACIFTVITKVCWEIK